MGIQAGIFNSEVRPAADPIAQYTRLSELRNIGLERQQKQQQIKQGDLTLKDLTQNQADKQALRDAYAKASQAGVSAQVNPGDMNLGGQTVHGATSTVKGPGFDRNIMLSELGRTAPHLIPQVQQTFAADDAAQAKAGLEQQQLKLAVAGQQIQRTAAVLAAAKDQPSYDAARQQLIAEKIPGADQIPPQFDPNYVAQHVQGAVPILEQIKNHQKDTEDKIQQQNADTAAATQKATAQHQTNEEALTRRGQDVTASTAKRGQDLMYGSLKSNIPPGVTGDKALLYMSPQLAASVQLVGSGRKDYNSEVARMNPASKGDFDQALLAFNPDYDQRKFGVGNAAMTAVAKSEVPTAIGNQKVAFNTAIAHADLLQQAAAALKNGDSQTLNGLKNRFKNEFGESGPITAQAIADAYTREVTSVISKGHMTDSEIGTVGKTIDTNRQNIGQIGSVIGAYKALAQSKMDQLQKQEDSALKRTQTGGGNQGGADHHVISVAGKNYQYNGTGDTADMKNYTEIAK